MYYNQYNLNFIYSAPQLNPSKNRNVGKNWNQPNQNRQGNNNNILPSLPVTQPQPPAPQPDTPAPLTQEDIEFDEQFRRWQEEFDNWKKANINHPDKHAYRMYEQQFESVRQKLVQVRIFRKLSDV
jgi:YLP motif-containing protein 1